MNRCTFLSSTAALATAILARHRARLAEEDARRREHDKVEASRRAIFDALNSVCHFNQNELTDEERESPLDHWLAWARRLALKGALDLALDLNLDPDPDLNPDPAQDGPNSSRK